MNYLYGFLFMCFSSLSVLAAQENFGHFVGNPEGKLIEDKIFELTKDYDYIDPSGIKWTVSAPFETDGASIPRVFWSLVGNPLGGNYRYAAIVHDYFCTRKYPDWERVHKNFYYGMRAKDVPEDVAWIMYRAVYLFGPRWKSRSIPDECDPAIVGAFDPDRCWYNNSSISGEALPSYKELNRVNLEEFLFEIQEKGYKDRADQLREQPDVKDILTNRH